MKKSTNVNRIIWASRRGLLELDLLLEPFIRSQYTQMNELDQRQFYEFLKLEDDQLFSWFFGSSQVPHEFLTIVNEILEFYAQE